MALEKIGFLSLNTNQSEFKYSWALVNLHVICMISRTKTNVLMPISLYFVLYVLTNVSVYLIKLHTNQNYLELNVGYHLFMWKNNDIDKHFIDVMKT